MNTQPMILPFNLDGTIYVVQDEQGRTIGTGPRHACAALLNLVHRAKSFAPVSTPQQQTHAEGPTNVQDILVCRELQRAAIDTHMREKV